MNSTLVDVKSAVEAARKYLQEVMDQLVDTVSYPIQGLRLEETELSENKEYWLITLGFDRPISEHIEPLQFSSNRKYERTYRIFKIDAKTKEVQSMKIREL